MTPQHHAPRFAATVLPLLLLVIQIAASAQGQAPTEVRAQLEGTWELVEWHIDGEVLRPPQIGGRWSNRDGVVMATFHRTSGGSFQSVANYGSYQMDATTWSYRYHHAQSTMGPTPEEATVSVRTGAPGRSFDVTRSGEMLMLDRPNDHREYEGREFRLVRNGQLLRKWRKMP